MIPIPMFRLTHLSGRSDVPVPSLPSVPARLRLHSAYLDALGLGASDDPEVKTLVQVHPPRPDDHRAVCWAALGLAGGVHGVKLPDWRELGRDPVVYGEAVFTALWDAGYQTPAELDKAGEALIEWMQAETLRLRREVAEGAAGFGEAPRS